MTIYTKNLPTIGFENGHDADAIRQATIEAKAETQKPTIIMCKTIIGLGPSTRRTCQP
jgi:transketolase